MIKIAICDDEKYFVDTVEKMLKIYAEKNGKDFCILSQEHSDEFSHRMVVSTWFRRFGYEVEEIVKYNK